MNEKGMWQELLTNKYLGDKTLSQVKGKPTDSPFWRGIMRVKDDFFSRGFFVVGNGTQTSFWRDVWLGNTPLSTQYPSLYAIAAHQNISVHDVMAVTPINLMFRRSVLGDKRASWLHLVEKLMRVSLSADSDSFRWRLTTNGVFYVKSLYADFMNGHTRYL